jgi:hypothetical protein
MLFKRRPLNFKRIRDGRPKLITQNESSTKANEGKKMFKKILWAPCPIIIVPPALIPGLARG